VAEGACEVSESGPRACQISGRERLADRREVLGAIRSMESLSIAKGAVLAERDQSVVSLLSSVRVARAQRLSQLLKPGFSLLPEIVWLLIGQLDGLNICCLLRVVQIACTKRAGELSKIGATIVITLERLKNRNV